MWGQDHFYVHSGKRKSIFWCCRGALDGFQPWHRVRAWPQHSLVGGLAVVAKSLTLTLNVPVNVLLPQPTGGSFSRIPQSWGSYFPPVGPYTYLWHHFLYALGWESMTSNPHCCPLFFPASLEQFLVFGPLSSCRFFLALSPWFQCGDSPWSWWPDNDICS